MITFEIRPPYPNMITRRKKDVLCITAAESVHDCSRYFSFLKIAFIAITNKVSLEIASIVYGTEIYGLHCSNFGFSPHGHYLGALVI